MRNSNLVFLFLQEYKSVLNPFLSSLPFPLYPSVVLRPSCPNPWSIAWCIELDSENFQFNPNTVRWWQGRQKIISFLGTKFKISWSHCPTAPVSPANPVFLVCLPMPEWSQSNGYSLNRRIRSELQGKISTSFILAVTTPNWVLLFSYQLGKKES